MPASDARVHARARVRPSARATRACAAAIRLLPGGRSPPRALRLLAAPATALTGPTRIPATGVLLCRWRAGNRQLAGAVHRAAGWPCARAAAVRRARGAARRLRSRRLCHLFGGRRVDGGSGHWRWRTPQPRHGPSDQSHAAGGGEHCRLSHGKPPRPQGARAPPPCACSASGCGPCSFRSSMRFLVFPFRVHSRPLLLAQRRIATHAHLARAHRCALARRPCAQRWARWRRTGRAGCRCARRSACCVTRSRTGKRMAMTGELSRTCAVESENVVGFGFYLCGRTARHCCLLPDVCMRQPALRSADRSLRLTPDGLRLRPLPSAPSDRDSTD